MAFDGFEYSAAGFEDALSDYNRLNAKYEEDINDLMRSLSEVLGSGTSGDAYDAFCAWFNREIKPRLEAILSKDKDVQRRTERNLQDFNDTTSGISRQMER